MKYFVNFVVIVLIDYLLWAFFTWQWNPAHWHEVMRFAYVVVTFFWSVTTAMYIEGKPFWSDKGAKNASR